MTYPWVVSVVKVVPDLKATGFVPELSLMSNRKEWWHIKNHLRRKNLVVFFVHDLDCGFCSRFLKALADDYQDWRRLTTEVVCVAPNSQEELEVFARETDIPFPLLGDVDGQAQRAFALEQLGPLSAPYIFAVDRFATLYFHDLADSGDPVQSERDIYDEIEFLESQCPECGVSRQSPQSQCPECGAYRQSS